MTRLINPNKRGASDKRLTPTERLFVKAMQADPMMNPAAAARAAGYKKNPSQAANKLMKRPAVMAILGKELHQRAEKFEIKADEVLQELHHLAMARGEDLFDEDGQFIPIKDMPERTRAAIKEFKVTEKILVEKGKKGKDGKKAADREVLMRVTEIKLHDKVTSIDMLMKHLGQYELDNKQKPGVTFDLSSLYVRPEVVDPVAKLTGEASMVVEPPPEPKKVEYKVDELVEDEE